MKHRSSGPHSLARPTGRVRTDLHGLEKRGEWYAYRVRDRVAVRHLDRGCGCGREMERAHVRVHAAVV